MRDLVILSIVTFGAIVALRRPWIGVMLWTWLSIMNPHRFAHWSYSYSAPIAAVAAASTLLGLLMTRERASPFKGAAPALLAAFSVWMTLSWLLGLDRAGDLPQWEKVMKINLMILVSLALLHSKQHIIALAWVSAGSLAVLGAKGGLFTLVHGGNYRVWGPPGSFIEDNNEFALSLVMAIPLLRFLQMQLSSAWLRNSMTVVMLLCASSVLGSHSRGAFLAAIAMALLLWWRGRSRILGGMVIMLSAYVLIAFMPEHWSNRMATIENTEGDLSVLGRFSAWWVAWRAAFDHPFGVGFNAARSDLFEKYSPYFAEMGTTHAAHSIYFQVLGNHGFVGLVLFLMIWIATWRAASRVRKLSAGIPQARWCADLAAMAQVSLVGYGVGGAFLSLSYFDLTYNIMVLVVLTLVWVRTKAWEREPVYTSGWTTVPGLPSSPQGAERH